MRFSRWHALGNAYLLVERAELTEPLTAAHVRAICDVDGIVEIASSAGDAADVVIWNRDGTTAEMSGNATRIAARWLLERSGAQRVRIRAGDREVASVLRADGLVEQDVGPVDVGERMTLDGVELVPVSVGNPHAVVDDDPAAITRVGPLLVGHAYFPGGTNVEVARVERAGEVAARVWERGVGETSASGTGAVAVAAATHAEGDVRVRFPGGELLVRLAGHRATLTGPAERIE